MNTTNKIFLLVDDDSDDKELFVEAVETVDATITCQTSSDGRHALEHLSKNEENLPQVIFLDINMPVMDGWQFLKILKSEGKYKHIPVIMYSTTSHQKDIDKAQELGALCLCVKPENFNMVKHLVKVVSENLGDNLLPAIVQYKKELNCSAA